MKTAQLLSLALAFFAASISTASAEDKPVHPEKWMFDTKPITATSPGKGKTTFKITERLYARVFYDRPIKEVFSLGPTSYQIKVYQKLVDSGSDYSQVPIWIPKKEFDNKWLDIEILPDPATAHTKYGAYGEVFHQTWIYAAEKKLTGSHEVYYEIIVGGGNGSAPDDMKDEARSARITIDFTGLDAKKLAADRKAVAEAGNAAFSANFTLPNPGRLHSAALAKQTEAMTKRNNSNVTAVKVIFTDADWGIARNEVTGRILSRDAAATAIVKVRSGKCTMEPGVIRQQYVGKKFAAPGEWLNVSTTINQIDCKKAFK